MTFAEKLRARSQEVGNILCMGLDPILERIPLHGDADWIITKFYADILEVLKSEDAIPAMVKPNAAFYEQYGISGMRALKRVIIMYKSEGIPVCLDAKRADIGNTSKAYSKAVFDELHADAVTLNPYLGQDSLQPFFREGKGCYILIRTSNPGARDLQDLQVEGKPLYIKTAEAIARWWNPSIAGVVGATYPGEMADILKIFVKQGKDLPLLIPGVGAQGGTVSEVIKSIKDAGSDPAIHRISSSSGINYAYEKLGGNYAEAAAMKVKGLLKDLSV